MVFPTKVSAALPAPKIITETNWLSTEKMLLAATKDVYKRQNQTFKDEFGAALLEYAQGTKTFDEVKQIVVESWKTESAGNNA